jgi:glycosyltransferase involved in cell wall biosynthesis
MKNGLRQFIGQLRKVLKKGYSTFALSQKAPTILNSDQLEVSPQSTIPVRKPTKRVMMVLWPFIAVGGAETLTLSLLKNPIISSQFDYITICLFNPPAYLGSLTQAFEEISIAYYGAENFADPNTAISAMVFLLKQFDVEVLFVPNGSGFFYNSVQQIKQHLPNLRIVNQVYDHHQGWISEYNKARATAIDYHIAPNNNIKAAYVSYGVPENKAPLIYHGIDTDEYSADAKSLMTLNVLKESLRLPTDKLIVTFAARMHPQKRPEDFLEIAKYFCADQRFHFFMVGDGELSEGIAKKVESDQLLNVTKIDFYSPIRDVYLSTDILVIPSEYEGLPLVLLQSQSMGVPVVATAVGAIPDVVRPNYNGLLISKPGDIDAFCQAIAELADRLDTFKQNCHENKPLLTQEFGITNMCEKYLAVFNGKL